jgi:hypothetical protein
MEPLSTKKGDGSRESGEAECQNGGVGRTLIMIGVAFVVAGLISMWVGRLPGDIVIRGKNVTFIFPVVTCLLLSLVLTLLMWLFKK